MNRLLVATRSKGKQAEFRALFATLDSEIVFPDDIGLPASAEEELLEPFDTFEANARSKARWFAAASGLLTIADDSGLEVDALNGAPGVHSKRFAGLAGSDDVVSEANNALLMSRLTEIPDGERTARYRCVLVASTIATGGPDFVADGSVEGIITRAPRGANGFGYDPFFYSVDLGCTFGEATREQKAEVSHRGRAAAVLVELLASSRV